MSTPLDYHRIVSQSLSVPSDPEVAVPVGLLQCQRDPLLRELSTVVVSSILSKPVSKPAPKSNKKSVLAPTLPTDKAILEVILHDTILFPEGGGQPTDIGYITTNRESWRVFQVKRRGGDAVHYIEARTTGDAALAAFLPGANVHVELGSAGFERRYDHMSMHTSQHLLSALLETQLNVSTLSWSLTAYPTPCYVDIPRSLSAEETAMIQSEANTLVFEGRKVHVEVKELDRIEPPKLENGRTVGRGLPGDYTGGVKRVVVIDGVDRNPCCGTHLPSLHNLQLFLLPHNETVTRSTTAATRLYFLAGPRLIHYLSSVSQQLTRVSQHLSCGIPDASDRVAKLLEDRRLAQSRAESIELELADLLARDLHQELLRVASGSKFYRHIHRNEDSSNSLGFVSAIALSFARICDSQATEQEWLFIFSSSPLSPSSTSTSVVLVTGSNDTKVKEVGDALRTRLSGVKGGGRGSRWSGKLTGIWKVATMALVDDIVKEAVNS